MTLKVDKAGAWKDVLDLQVVAGGAWRRVLNAYVLKTGVWQPCYTYVPNINTTTNVSVSSTTINNAPTGSVTVSGTVVRSSDGTTPVPAGGTVELYNGATKLGTTTTNASGGYSFTFTPTVTGVYTLTVKYLLSGYYQPSQANTPAITVNTTTSVSASLPTYGVIGTSFTASGIVSSATGETPTGTATLYVNGVSRGSVALSAGAYSISFTPGSGDHGTYNVYVAFTGSGRFLSANSTTVAKTIYQPTPGTPSQTVTAISNTSVNLRVTDLADVAYFVSYCTETGNSQTVYSTGVAGTALDFPSWGLGQDQTYHFTITAYSDNPVDNNTAGNTITVTTGHAAITDSGGPVAFTFNSVETNSWRSIDGWGYLGTDLAQGYFSSGNGPYYGIGRFDYSAMRSSIDAYGTDRSGRWSHVTCSKLEVYLTRQTGSGSSSAVPIGWYMSSTNPGSGTSAPNLTYGPDTSSPSGLATGDSGWLQLPDETWATKLLAGTYISLAMYYNGSANYSQYNGGSGFKVRMTLSWNYTFLAYKAPTWSG